MKRCSRFSKTLCLVTLVACVCFLFTGCSSTRMVDSLDGAAPSVRPLKRLLVLGVFKSDLRRKVVEEQISKALAEEGTTGIKGYTLIPDVTAYKDKEDIRKAVESARADGAVLVVFKGKNEKTRNVPPQVDYVPTHGMYHGLYEYYGMSYRAVYTPGYTVTDTILDLELTLFDAKTEKMLWAGATQTRNPQSAKGVADEAGELMVKELKKRELL